MASSLVELVVPWLVILLIFPFYSFFIVLTVWLVVWIGILCKLPRALARFGAEVVREYRSILGG